MNERIELKLVRVERWSKRGREPVRVKCHLEAQMFGPTTARNLVDHLAQETVKMNSPLMRGEITRSIDLEHTVWLDQVSFACSILL